MWVCIRKCNLFVGGVVDKGVFFLLKKKLNLTQCFSHATTLFKTKLHEKSPSKSLELVAKVPLSSHPAWNCLFSKNGVDFHAGAQKKPQKPQRTGEGSVEKMESPCKQHAKNRMLCFDVMKKSSWTHTHTHTHTHIIFILFYFILLIPKLHGLQFTDLHLTSLEPVPGM